MVWKTRHKLCSGFPDIYISRAVSSGFPDDFFIWKTKWFLGIIWISRHKKSTQYYFVFLLSGFPDTLKFLENHTNLFTCCPDHWLLQSGFSRLCCCDLDFQTGTLRSGYPDDILCSGFPDIHSPVWISKHTTFFGLDFQTHQIWFQTPASVWKSRHTQALVWISKHTTFSSLDFQTHQLWFQTPASVWKSRHTGSGSGLDFQILLLWSGFPDSSALSWISRQARFGLLIQTTFFGLDFHTHTLCSILWSGFQTHDIVWSGFPDTSAMVKICRTIFFHTDIPWLSAWSWISRQARFGLVIQTTFFGLDFHTEILCSILWSGFPDTRHSLVQISRFASYGVDIQNDIVPYRHSLVW